VFREPRSITPMVVRCAGHAKKLAYACLCCFASRGGGVDVKTYSRMGHITGKNSLCTLWQHTTSGLVPCEVFDQYSWGGGGLARFLQRTSEVSLCSKRGGSRENCEEGERRVISVAHGVGERKKFLGIRRPWGVLITRCVAGDVDSNAN